MIGEWADLPDDPLSDQHGAFGHDGPPGDPYGALWHEESPDQPCTGPDHAEVWPAGTPGGSTGPAAAPESATGHGGVDPGQTGRGVPPDQPRPDPGHHHGTAGRHPDPSDDLAHPPSVALGPDVSPFPARLELGVTPTDGRDWVDVDLLGVPAPGSGAAFRSDPPGQLLADLHRLDGGDGAPSWSAVAASDDPAVRALGRRWQPG